MNYPNIKKAKLSHRQIAKAFGYKNVNSFRSSSAHKRHMQGVDNILELIKVEVNLGTMNGQSVLIKCLPQFKRNEKFAKGINEFNNQTK